MMRCWGLVYGYHYVGRLDDGCRLPAFLETQLLDSFISDGEKCVRRFRLRWSHGC